MLGRRQGEVAPTRRSRCRSSCRPSGRPRKSTLWLSASRVVPHPRRRTLSPSWSIECRGSALGPGPARL